MAEKMGTEIYLSEIKDNEFRVKELPDNIKDNFEDEKLRIGINVSFDTASDKKLLAVIVGVGYEYMMGEDEKIELLKCRTTYLFKLSNFDELITFEGEEINISDKLAKNLASVSLSTTRGIINEKSKGYFINSYKFPVFNTDYLDDIISRKE